MRRPARSAPQLGAKSMTSGIDPKAPSFLATTSADVKCGKLCRSWVVEAHAVPRDGCLALASGGFRVTLLPRLRRFGCKRDRTPHPLAGDPDPMMQRTLAVLFA